MYIVICACIKKDNDELKDAIDEKKKEEKYNDEYPLGGTVASHTNID